MFDRTNQQSDSNASGVNEAQSLAPAISLLKGGGAIRGIGEKFAVNPVAGTGSMTVPIFTSPGRYGFDPQLAFSYDSGVGNRPFGFGWNLSLPSITCKTDKGLPQYRDAEEFDVFILSGAEDLGPMLAKSDGQWQHDTPTVNPGSRKYLSRCMRKLFDINLGRQRKRLVNPRASHAITLAVDYFGNVLQSVAIGQGRRHDDLDPVLTKADRNKQKQLLIRGLAKLAKRRWRHTSSWHVPNLRCCQFLRQAARAES